MENYKQLDVAGTKYRRAYAVKASNHLGEPRVVTMDEEEVVVLADGSEVKTPVGRLREILTDENMAEVVDVVHPYTGDKIGESSYGEIYALLASLYLHMGKKRDLAEAAEAAAIAEAAAEEEAADAAE